MANLGQVKLNIEITLECGHKYHHTHESSANLSNAEVVNDAKVATELATRLAMTTPHQCNEKLVIPARNVVESNCDDCGLK